MIEGEVVVSCDVWKKYPELLPTDPLAAAIHIGSALLCETENLLRLVDMPASKLRGKSLRVSLTHTLLEFIGRLNLMHRKLEAGDGWTQLTRLYKANGVEFGGRYAGSYALLAFNLAYELAATFATDVRTADNQSTEKIVDVDSAVSKWNFIRKRIQQTPRIDLGQLRERLHVEQVRLERMLEPIPADESPKRKLTVNLVACIAIFDGQEIQLTRNQAKALDLLIRNQKPYMSLAAKGLRSRDIDTLPPALKELVETQPGAGTRILRDKVELA